MSGSELHIVGAGGYARCIADVACVSGYSGIVFYEKGGFSETIMMGFPIIDEKKLADIPLGSELAVGVGDNSVREAIVKRLKSERPDLHFPVLIHRDASVSRFAKIGAGSVVMAQSVVGPCAQIGEHVAIYSGAVVEHDCCIRNFVTLAPLAACGGTVTMGTRSFLGLGATVNHGIPLEDDTIIGAGASVVKKLPGKSIAVGVPARVVRAHAQFENYL